MDGNKQPFASFCISTFKRKAHLLSTLKSIAAQTFTNYEVVVSDNDPEQSAKEVVLAMNDSRFKYFANIENLGMKKSFNKSLERSTGDYIVMIADDDPVYPDMLETLVHLQQQYPGYGMYLGGCDWFCTHHEVGKLYGLKVGTNSCLSNNHDLNYTAAFTPGEFIQKLFTFQIFPHYLWSTGIVSKRVLTEQGGVPDYGTAFLGDYAYMSIMAAHSGCVIINKSLGCQTLHNENFGRSQNEQLAIVAKRFPEYLETKMHKLNNWPTIKKLMLDFTGVWLVSHLTFLNKYGTDTSGTLKAAEKEIFKMPYMKKFRFKYFMKKNYPTLHDQLVKLKQTLK
jgi:glycosyltransferase involved in cell wall biosynthesis